MMILSPKSTRQICDMEMKSLEDLTYGDLRKYYDIHIQMWKSFKARGNSLNDRLKKITQT